MSGGLATSSMPGMLCGAHAASDGPRRARGELAALTPLFPYGVAQHTSTPFIVPDGELAITDQRAG